MAGVLITGDDKARDGVEATGIYEGVLKEDMIDTVRRVKKNFIDVYISSLFFEDADYPLTYVPVFNMVLPLKRGQKVWVYFNQDNHRYPVLWKVDGDVLGSGVDFNSPSSGDLFMYSHSKVISESVGKTKIKAAGIDLGVELHKFFDTLSRTTPTVQGSPTAQSFNPAIVTALVELVSKLSVSFKES